MPFCCLRVTIKSSLIFLEQPTCFTSVHAHNSYNTAVAQEKVVMTFLHLFLIKKCLNLVVGGNT